MACTRMTYSRHLVRGVFDRKRVADAEVHEVSVNWILTRTAESEMAYELALQRLSVNRRAARASSDAGPACKELQDLHRRKLGMPILRYDPDFQTE
jgi:hypothetical protein